jgi:hypothetical protein
LAAELAEACVVAAVLAAEAGLKVVALARQALVPTTQANSALWLAKASEGGTRWLVPVIVTSERM